MTRYSYIKASARNITNKTERAAEIYLKYKRELYKSPITIRSISKDFNILISSTSNAVKLMRACKPILRREGIPNQNYEEDNEIDNWLDSGI